MYLYIYTHSIAAPGNLQNIKDDSPVNPPFRPARIAELFQVSSNVLSRVVSLAGILPDDFNQERTFARAASVPMCVIILGDFWIRAGVTSRRCYRSLVYQVRCVRHSQSVCVCIYVHVYIYTHTHIYSPPSMALLSLCIKPLSPIALTPRRSRLSTSASRSLLIFHDFIPAVSSRLQPLLRPVQR